MIISTTELYTKFGTFEVSLHKANQNSFEECLTISSKPFLKIPYIRIHSACLFGEAFHSIECDCKTQLTEALEVISKKSGVILYLFQEGRGIGLEGKIKAMNLEKERNYTSSEAFSSLGFPIDSRDYSFAISIMKTLGLPNRIILLSENNNKITAVKKGGFNLIKLQ